MRINTMFMRINTMFMRINTMFMRINTMFMRIAPRLQFTQSVLDGIFPCPCAPERIDMAAHTSEDLSLKVVL
jgi:hypothetical protein